MNTWSFALLCVGGGILLAAFLVTILIGYAVLPDMNRHDLDELADNTPLIYIWFVSCMLIAKAIGFVLDIVFKPIDLALDGIKWVFGKRGE